MAPTDIEPSRLELMHRWIAEALRRVGFSTDGRQPPTGPVPMTRILEAFHITLQPVPKLTRNKAREFLRLPAAEDPQAGGAFAAFGPDGRPGPRERGAGQCLGHPDPQAVHHGP